MAEDQEIQALKERIIILETKIEMLDSKEHERPFWVNVLIGFAVTLGFILLLTLIIPAILLSFN
ncbi:hypothetical protein ACFOLF_26390 [Paenibacillus sepulcri]|uniref:Uncharacterized protein n=1 Tax=Paenibacillus sepulcri TaxID=359917 RepID=A0ABS7BV05_9BACL|nr:hypothetical protein [Paenibacillus sepulcri]